MNNLQNKKNVFILLFVFIIHSIWAVELIPTKTLLASYLEQDSDLKYLALELQKAQLNYKSVVLEKGFNVKLNSGEMTFVFGSDSSFSVNPGVSADFPQYKNLGLDLNGTLFVNENSVSFTNAAALFSVDLISSADAANEVDMLEAERKILEAQRNLVDKSCEKEEAFYKGLSSILSSISELVTKKNTLIDDHNSFETVKLQGYSSASSAYIRAEMKVRSDEHEIEQAVHELVSDYKLFYLNCGCNIEIPENTDFTDLIPEDIPVVEAIDISLYSAEQYKEIESAKWTQSINQKTRNGSKKFTLSANGGYSYKNSVQEKGNSLNAGVTASYQGLSVSTGVSIPVELSKSSPSVSLEFSYSPFTAKKNEISDALNQISVAQEQMKVDSAYKSYESCLREEQLKLSDIKWNEETCRKNYEMYVDAQKEMERYYKKGLVSEKDYSSAVINTLQAKVEILMNRIDLIVYNGEVRSLFVE